MERITVTIDKRTLLRIKSIVGKRGVSKFIAEAAEEKLGYAALDAWLDEMDAKYGPPPKKLQRAIERDFKKIFGIK